MKIINPIFVKNKRAIEGIFLGTGTSQGIPVIGATIPYAKALILRTKTSSFCLDHLGRLLIRNRLRPISGNKCLRLIVKSRWDSFTHEHADHTSGIDDIVRLILNKERSLFMPMIV
jgi:phosphoribosyl 1,2-cyclic phosphate phosphodiesterase